MSRSPRMWSAMLFLLPVVACEDNAGPGVEPCTTANSENVALGVGEYASVDAYAALGCIMFPANPGASQIEYLIVPQAATGTPGRTLNFKLQGDGVVMAAAPVGIAPSLQSAPGSAARRFHEFLRQGDEARAWGTLRAERGPVAAPAAAMSRIPKPIVGDKRSFSVCSDLNCQTFAPVGAVARAVGQRLAIFIDTLAPPNGLTPSDLSALITLFDSRLYAVDTLAFGRESDINQDSVVIVLMTNVVNRLVSAAECDANGAYVAGFFLGADIDPLFATDSRLNHLEVFYSIVPDPSGTLSCAHSVSQVTRFVPITFIHEFQHMISYNQHVLIRRRNGEQLWLNEALSHYAEELGGRSFLAQGDNQTFTDYVIGDLYNAYQFLEEPGAHFLVPRTGIGLLEERGAQWLFVRYLVDQFAAGNTGAEWDTFTRRLVQTGDTGATNVQVVTGTPFATVVGRWALTNWVDDLAGFATPAALTYESWNLRSTYAQLNSQNATRFPQPFPLIPTSSDGSAIDLSGTLRAGSGIYHRALQAAGAAAFVLTFRAPDGWALAPSHSPRLNVIRIQ